MKENKGSGYFSRFGLAQLCDIIFVAATIVLIVGLFVEPPVVGIVGFSMFALGSAITAVRRIVMLMASSKGTPEFRNSLIIAIAMTVVFALSVLGIVGKSMFLF